MTRQEVQNLRTGDVVFWEDPDDGICSRRYVISRVAITGDQVTLEDADASVLECYASELALSPPADHYDLIYHECTRDEAGVTCDECGKPLAEGDAIVEHAPTGDSLPVLYYHERCTGGDA